MGEPAVVERCEYCHGARTPCTCVFDCGTRWGRNAEKTCPRRELAAQQEALRPAEHSAVFRNGSGKPVVGIDIDGTLGDYHAHFLKFAEGWLGRPLPPADEINPGMRLSDFMGIEHSLYRRVKLAYRQGGMKRTMPVYPHSSALTHTVRREDGEVWLCTTRPYSKLDNIDEDTREWLDRNRIHYDAILFDDGNGQGKYTELVRQVGAERVVAVVDDLTANLDEATAAGIQKTYLVDQPYNRVGVKLIGLRVSDMRALIEQLTIDIRAWKARQCQTTKPASS